MTASKPIKLTLRVQADVHNELARIARDIGVSKNAVILVALREYLAKAS